VNPGDTLTLTVIDSDLDLSGAAETVSVVVVNQSTGESEAVLLTETTGTSGVFQDSLATQFNTMGGPDDDGVIFIQSRDIVTVTYDDVLRANGGADQVESSSNVGGGTNGSITITPSARPGDRLFVTVDDADLDTSPTSQQSVTVTLVNLTTSEQETITLQETGSATGVFQGSVETVFGMTAGTDNTGTFNVQAGDTIRATYADSLNIVGQPASVTADCSVGAGSDGTVSFDLAPVPGEALRFTVADPDLNADPLTRETATVTVTNGSESELVTVTEDGTNAVVFRGVLPTVFGTSSGGNNTGSLVVEAGDTVTVRYEDALNALGGSSNRTDTVEIAGGTDGVLSVPAEFNLGGVLSIQVEDADLNELGSALEALVVDVVNLATGELEQVALTESGPNSGVFRGTVATRFGSDTGTSNDEVL
ncbi:MAG: hypothetical protein AAFX94_20395, partial [Myxococcota bacterium]